MSATRKDENVEALRRRLADLAIRLAREGFHIELDYSVRSVKAVDEILAALHAEYRRTGNRDGIEGLGLEFGAYITYVIDKNFSPAGSSGTIQNSVLVHFHSNGTEAHYSPAPGAPNRSSTGRRTASG